MREPTQGKPFDYSQIKIAFSDEDNLKRQERTHTGQKPFDEDSF